MAASQSASQPDPQSGPSSLGKGHIAGPEGPRLPGPIFLCDDHKIDSKYFFFYFRDKLSDNITFPALPTMKMVTGGMI